MHVNILGEDEEYRILLVRIIYLSMYVQKIAESNFTCCYCTLINIQTTTHYMNILKLLGSLYCHCFGEEL